MVVIQLYSICIKTNFRAIIPPWPASLEELIDVTLSAMISNHTCSTIFIPPEVVLSVRPFVVCSIVDMGDKLTSPRIIIHHR